MKNLTYLFLALIIVACSDDSSDGNQLFLEKYNGVVWIKDNGYKIAFDNNTQSYIQEDGEFCNVQPIQGSYTTAGGNDYIFLIEEETENSLTRKTTYYLSGGGEESSTAVYTVDGNTLTEVFSYGDIFVWTRTDDVPCE